MKNNVVEPVVNWAGGKRWLKQVVEEFYINSGKEHYIEPFAGGMAAALHIKPEVCTINDINKHLILFYKLVAKGGLTIKPSEFGVVNGEVLPKYKYEQLRDKFNKLIKEGNDDTEEAAILFYILMRTGFNGLCRFNKKGLFSTPWGQKKAYVGKSFSEHEDVIKNWNFISQDFQEIVVDDAFNFIDSPYDESFTQYWQTNFRDKDQERVIEWAYDSKSPFLLTNSATPFIEQLIKEAKFEYRIITKRHIIGADPKSRALKPEIIAWRGVKAPDSVLKLN